MVEIKGGDKLAAKLKELSAHVSKASTLQVGFLEDATEADGTPVAMVAAIQEFGAPARKIPPRPFFRTMIAAKSESWGDAVAALLVDNDYDAAKTLGMMGEGISGQLRQSIIDVDSPPLSILTLLIRKWKTDHPDKEIGGSIIGDLAAKLRQGPPDVSGVSTKPLVDTGNMLNSVSYKVNE